MSEQTPVFGIDLGTTYSCIAYVDEFNRPTVVKNDEGANITPSVVQFDGEEIVVGMAAKNSSAACPNSTISMIKREMGKNEFRFDYEGTEYSPEEISSFILRKVVKDAKEYTGHDIKDVVITCPAYFGESERKATEIAGKMAGLNVLSIINEPTAAAICYGIDEQADRTVLVYDLGGGTFDVTIIKIENGNITVVCTDGDHELGGRNWDEALVSYFAAEWCRENNSSEDPLESLETMNEWFLEAEKAKKTLTGKTKTTLQLYHEGEKVKISLTREIFNELTESLLNRTIELTKLAIAEAEKRNVESFDTILLVGGSTRMPQVSERLEQEFGLKPEVCEPDESVAKGAAIYGFKHLIEEKLREKLADEQNKNSEDIDINSTPKEDLEKLGKKLDDEMGWLPGTTVQNATIKIVNVTSRSFGVIVYKNDELCVSNLILVNDPLPANVTQKFYTREDNQIGVDITIVDNFISDKDCDTSDSREIGKAELAIPPNMPKGTPIEITYQLTEQGLLRMHARELTEGNEIQIEIQNEGVVTEKEIEEAIERLKHLVMA
jgi:molecular chaperone DnaK (HSP70)